MAVIRTFSGDGLSPGAMTTSTAGAGDTAFNTVNAGFEIANEGTRPPCIKLVKPAAAAPLIHWTVLGDLTNFALRTYFVLGSLPSGTFQLISTSSSTDARSLDIGITTSGGLTVRDTANTVRGTIAGLQEDTLYRVEAIQTPTNTTVRLFNGHSIVPLGEVTYAMAGVPLNRFRLGVTSSSVVIDPILLDDVQVANTADWLGPSVAPAPVGPAYRWNGSDYVALDAHRWGGSSYAEIDSGSV